MDLTGLFLGDKIGNKLRKMTLAERRLCILRIYNKSKCERAQALADRAKAAVIRLYGSDSDRTWEMHISIAIGTRS